MPKSARELELIIMRLKSQIEAKNEQIEKTNQYIQEATDQQDYHPGTGDNASGRTACQGGSNAQTGTDKVQGNLRDDEA